MKTVIVKINERYDGLFTFETSCGQKWMDSKNRYNLKVGSKIAISEFMGTIKVEVICL